MTGLATAPSSAIPAALRKPLGVDANAADKHAAAIVFVAPDGDILLLKRSPDEKNYGGYWGLPGGNVEAGETPWQGAMRESEEEIGDGAGDQIFNAWYNRQKAREFDRRITPTGMLFHTFALPAMEKFEPKLNSEHTEARWTPLDQLPALLHPGVRASLADRLGIADGMTPADWDGLRSGFLKWTLEEEAEPNHLNGDAQIKMKKIKFVGDAALSLALDRGSVRTTDKDGHLHIVEANVCKECVSPYRGSEVPGWKELGLDPERVYQFYRAGDELKKAAPTINGKPLVRVHKPTSAEDHQYWDTVGSVGTTARWEAPYVKNGLTVWTAPDIAAIESGEKRELSPGYRWKPVMETGTFEGESFDGIMTEILFNHLCLVEDGRQGDDVVVGDGKNEAAWAAIEEAILAAGC